MLHRTFLVIPFAQEKKERASAILYSTTARAMGATRSFLLWGTVWFRQMRQERKSNEREGAAVVDSSLSHLPHGVYKMDMAGAAF